MGSRREYCTATAAGLTEQRIYLDLMCNLDMEAVKLLGSLVGRWRDGDFHPVSRVLIKDPKTKFAEHVGEGCEGGLVLNLSNLRPLCTKY